MSLVEVYKLTKYFGAAKIVDNISFSLEEGEIVGLLGPNGAGKTTTLWQLLGVLTPTSGEIRYFNKSLSADREEILSRVGFASTYIRLPGRLTVYENLAVYATIFGLSRHEAHTRITNLLTQFALITQQDQLTATLSAGQMARLMLAKAFINSPRIVLLDEPTAALDPDVARDVRSYIRSIQEHQKVTVFMTSHNMMEVTELCSRVLALRTGKIIADDTPQALIRSVGHTKVHLFVEVSYIPAIKIITQEFNGTCSDENNWITVTLEENCISRFLIALAQQSIAYRQISIDAPTLEDYFLHIAQGKA